MDENQNEVIDDVEVNEKSFDDVKPDNTINTQKVIEDSIDKIVNAVKDIKINQEQQKPKKFKIGLFGYLTIALIVKCIISVVHSICNRRK